MAQNTTINCDACKKAIDLTKGKISFVPIRGGLTLTVENGTGQNAGLVVDHQMDFCDETCLAEFAKQIREKIIVSPAPAPKAE